MNTNTKQLDFIEFDKNSLIKNENDFINRKNFLLKSLKSPSPHIKYKRLVRSTLRYAGGKSLAVGLIAEMLPNNVKRIMSPFFGGGSVEIALAKDLGLEVYGYDIFDLLVNFWKFQINSPSDLAKKLKMFNPTKDGFNEAKKRLKQHWDKEKEITDELELAAYYYFNHNTSYGPHFLGHPSSVYLQQKRYNDTLEKVKNFDVDNLYVDCLTFDKSIPKHFGDFIYADPPYFLGGDSKTFIGMYPHRNFPIHHKGFDHVLLRDLLMAHKGGFILSYNDCSDVRELYKGCEMYTPKWQYTFSQGDTRIGENRLRDNNGSHVKKSHEIIIWKY